MYKDFAYIYDELMDDVDYRSWYKYIIDILNYREKHVEDILEMACGTGRIAEYFLEDGYRLTCFDISDDMLSVAENRLRKYKNKKILRHDMVDFKSRDSYDLIMSNCDSINYIIDKEELMGTFYNVRENLREGGLFIFDINSSYKLTNILSNNIFVEDREDIFYTWENYLYQDEHVVEFFLSFFVREEDGRYRRFDEEHIERIYEIDEMIRVLEDSGFKNIEVFESFGLGKPRTDSERITFVASK